MDSFYCQVVIIASKLYNFLVLMTMCACALLKNCVAEEHQRRLQKKLQRLFVQVFSSVAHQINKLKKAPLLTSSRQIGVQLKR